jgi:hypothetical protein
MSQYRQMGFEGTIAAEQVIDWKLWNRKIFLLYVGCICGCWSFALESLLEAVTRSSRQPCVLSHQKYTRIGFRSTRRSAWTENFPAELPLSARGEGERHFGVQ